MLKICAIFAILLVVRPIESRRNDRIGDVIHSISNIFTFLCTRCEQIVVLVDEAIDNETLKKDASKLCDSVLGFNEILDKICQSVVEDILGEIYVQLKRFEPNQSICAHLHLCDACSFPTPLPSMKLHANSTGNVLSLIGNIAKLQTAILELNF
ncbi:unnamed protein product [Caenorhabditis bovis]|uniref:Saposin B-type domain-containing protein n=1 Tax=Caenorhabditis bovis TaxID=2654633 RepID=A0A8S1EVQ4_9PELO|nr:unnamed protein product [Caenorhabditis bovis]